LDPNKVGGGVSPGWDDDMCQSVAQQASDWNYEAGLRSAKGDLDGAKAADQISQSLDDLVNQHCWVQED
jgi:hypothetical protein